VIQSECTRILVLNRTGSFTVPSARHKHSCILTTPSFLSRGTRPAARRNVQTDGKTGVQVEVQARVTNDEEQDSQTASYAYELLDRLASHAAKNGAPSDNNAHREFDSPSAATATPIKPRRVTAASKTSPAPAVITKIDRMKTRQGDSLFLKVDVNGETVRVFGRPEELAERLEASGYDIPASEIEAGMELHLPCSVKVGQNNGGYKTIEEFLPEAAA
jgi:hypothetical protein